MNNTNRIISILSAIIMTILLIFANTLNSVWPRILITLMFYIIFVWFRITRWWNIVFDVLLGGLMLSYLLLFDSISNDMRFNLFILFAFVSGLYFIVIAIAKFKGYPLSKGDNEVTKK